MQSPESPPRRTSNLRALIALNGVLLALLAAVTLAPTVNAQLRPRGQYLMVAGGANNVQSSVVYVIDTVNQEMIALTYDAASRTVNGLAYRNIAADAADLVGRARAGG
jgi:hypothetical protein